MTAGLGAAGRSPSLPNPREAQIHRVNLPTLDTGGLPVTSLPAGQLMDAPDGLDALRDEHVRAVDFIGSYSHEVDLFGHGLKVASHLDQLIRGRSRTMTSRKLPRAEYWRAHP
jgi:hypothetical protein